MGLRKIATTVYLTPEQDSLLKTLHQQTRQPVAALVREGIDLVLRRYSEARVAPVPASTHHRAGADRDV